MSRGVEQHADAVDCTGVATECLGAVEHADGGGDPMRRESARYAVCCYGGRIRQTLRSCRNSDDADEAIRHEDRDDEYVHDLRRRAEEVVVGLGHELADLVEKQTEPDPTDDDGDDPRTETQEQPSDQKGQHHRGAAVQGVCDVQRSASDLWIAGQGQVQPSHQNGDDGDDQERLGMGAAVRAPQDSARAGRVLESL
ncbi:hypothetical protein [Rhodococcus zopfii]|uniref:hypothetical protein n=1 Tax=Rhodococcus zopfii TaxID=43772 RepID=UPI001EE03A57|nr:hypothetical protein [Rhodococcus zopfii]